MRLPRAYHPRACHRCMLAIFVSLRVRHWVSEAQRRFIMRAHFERLRWLG